MCLVVSIGFLLYKIIPWIIYLENLRKLLDIINVYDSNKYKDRIKT